MEQTGDGNEESDEVWLTEDEVMPTPELDSDLETDRDKDLALQSILKSDKASAK